MLSQMTMSELLQNHWKGKMDVKTFFATLLFCDTITNNLCLFRFSSNYFTQATQTVTQTHLALLSAKSPDSPSRCGNCSSVVYEKNASTNKHVILGATHTEHRLTTLSTIHPALIVRHLLQPRVSTKCLHCNAGLWGAAIHLRQGGRIPLRLVSGSV